MPARVEHRGDHHDVRTHGVAGDGKTVDTAAIQAAIDACAASGGGTVVVPPGCFVTGSIVLRSRVEFHFAAGATLCGAAGPEHYRVIESRYGGYVGFNATSEGGGVTQPPGLAVSSLGPAAAPGGDPARRAAPRVSREAHRPLIFADEAEDLVISGPGTIDGSGAPWWELKRSGPLERPRPTLIGLNGCRRVTIRDVRLVDSPSWTVQPVLCTDVAIHGESARPLDETTPVFSDIRLAGVTCRGATSAAGFVSGLPEMPVRRRSIRGVDIEVVSRADLPARVAAVALAAEPTRGAGYLCRHAEDVRLDGCAIRGAVGEPWRFEECTRVEGSWR